LFLVRSSLAAVSGLRLINTVLATVVMGGLTWLIAPLGIVVQVMAGGASFIALALLLHIPTSEEVAYAINFSRRFVERLLPGEAAA